MATSASKDKEMPWIKEYEVMDIKFMVDTRKFHDYDFVRKLSDLGETSLAGIFYTTESIIIDHDAVIDNLRDEDGYLSIDTYADFAHQIINKVNEAKN